MKKELNGHVFICSEVNMNGLVVLVEDAHRRKPALKG